MEGNLSDTRGNGFTLAEQYLKRLCDRSFLSLWSYANIFRDQGRAGGRGDGHEVSDLVVVFENHVILFSDKDCVFPDTGNLDVDWSRWYRRAIKKSADQLWGAERWIREHPDRLFTDPACTLPLPIDLPDSTAMQIHRVLVAHGLSERCREYFKGGSGSLLLMFNVVGDDHIAKREDGGVPFAIGQIDPSKGFIHVLDDISLDIVMGEVDTISDFVAYLMKKEQAIRAGSIGGAAGEEELLAFYLGKLNANGEHDFVVPVDARMFVDYGHWEDFRTSPERLSRIEANEVSYAWDRLIEHFSGYMLEGTQYAAWPDFGVRDGEKLLRFLAREPRMRRRMLATALVEALMNTQNYQGGEKFARLILPSNPGDPYYVLMLLKKPDFLTYEQYRDVRLLLLETHCNVVKLKFPDALDIVGIATEMGIGEGSSEDAVYLDGRLFTEEDRIRAEKDAAELHIFEDLTPSFRQRVHEYPHVAALPQPRMKGRNRNHPCPCGSGKKFKHCHGKA